MRIVVAGASGLIGSELVASLRAHGQEVFRLVRSGDASPDAIPWNPAARQISAGALDGVDVVVNLAGENIGAGRWTDARKKRILVSRVDATATLAAAIGSSRSSPRTLINASAVGCYGDRGDEPVTETSRMGNGFLAEVCRTWEREALKTEAFGTRVALLRFGLVIAGGGGALGKMLPLFRLGVGGRLGSGTQWMSWVHVADVIGVIEAALSEESYSGPLNVVSPAPVRNAEFTTALARVVRRPAVLPVPAFALRLAFGEMADEALLASTRAVPSKLHERRYAFKFPELDAALRDAVRQERSKM